MGTHQENISAETGTAPEIEALLSLSQTASIVDRLLSLPVMGEDEGLAQEWNRAVAKRLEGRLADTMRTMLNTAERRDAA
jgi:hypothetical protein